MPSNVWQIKEKIYYTQMHIYIDIHTHIYANYNITIVYKINCLELVIWKAFVFDSLVEG